MTKSCLLLMLFAILLVAHPASAQVPPSPQQPPAPAGVPVPATKVNFKDAVERALANNPSVQQATTDILRAEGLLKQARSAMLPTAGASVITTSLNEGRAFDGTVTTPQNQVSSALTLGVPVLAPAIWAERTQARDLVHVAETNTTDVRRQIAVATAQAYLSIIARRRVFEADVRARETARAHFDLAHQQRLAGSGSLLNELRAQQALAADEVLVEQASLEVYRAQEALGVLMAADGAVDTSDEPVLDVPEGLAAAEAAMPSVRTDVRLAAVREAAAERVWKDSWRDWFPTAQLQFQPQYVAPGSIFQPSSSWSAQVVFRAPLFDAGYRGAVRAQRKALFGESQLQYAGVLRQARSDVRTADEAVKSAARALDNARSAAEQARHVLDIVNVSFRAGAATEIEVIDAQRALLDAETSVAVSEDQLRQAKLSLLVAVGKFPG